MTKQLSCFNLYRLFIEVLMRLIECVPNFSEGKNKEIINQIVKSIEEHNGIILDVDTGEATNRTVVTFVTTPENIVNAAFACVKKASELIDMSKHKGAHARMGATDVCPFIPLEGVSYEECIELSNQLGKKVGEELNIPVYLYEKSAKREVRQNLANIREGEYEGFFEKIKKEEWYPDYGPKEFNVKSGGTVIGVREFLVAYNINLNTKSVAIAKEIANKIREKGYPKRDENGTLVKDENGNTIYIPGLFKDIKAVGWYIDEYQRAQISINFTNYKITPIYTVFDTVCHFANEFGIRATGSELVGLIPKQAIIDAGLHYLKKSKISHGVSEKEIILTAVQSLGLSELYPFVSNEKIIEYKVAKKRPLISMTVTDFVDELASNSPAPGGGSIAALSASLSSGLASMVANLTFGKKKYEAVYEEMKEIAYQAQQLKQFFINVIDDDTDAFNVLMEQFKLPKKTEEEQKIRNEKIQDATKQATLIPFSVLAKIPESLKLTMVVVKKGNQSALSDGGVSSLMAKSAAYGAYYNVLINLKSITDENFKNDLTQKANEIIKEVNNITDEIQNYILEQLK